MRIALDTNILAYAEGVNGVAMRDRALGLIQSLPQGTTLLPVQILGELFSLLVRKAGRSAVVVSASVDAGCRLLLTDDLHDGFTWRGLTITNPFASTQHPLLSDLLEG